MVKELGEGVTGWKPGERVIAGSTWGGFAEEMAVEADRLLAHARGAWTSCPLPPSC